MSFATIFLIIATFLWVICALLVVAKEPEFLSLDALGWFLIGTPFFAAGHWVPGHTHNLGGS